MTGEVATSAGRPRRARWLRPRRIFAVTVLVLLSPAVYSYVTTMMKPSSLPLWPRSVEWLRAHHGNWLVDEVEHYYYSWTAPSKGGPQLKALPLVGLGAPRRRDVRTSPVRHRHVVWPRRIDPVFAAALPGEGVWRRTGPLVHGRPPVLVTTFRTETDYPRIVAYVAWFDHAR
jgi:hypothetical protein